MKRITFLALSAMLLCLTASAQEHLYIIEQEHLYIIDGKHVENFDGSQLVGKTVRHYEIKHQEQLTIHNISTTGDWAEIEGATSATTVRVLSAEEAAALPPTAAGKMKTSMVNPLLIVDGREFTGNITDIDADEIKSVNVYKADSEFAKSYGDKGKNGVIQIFTGKQPEAVTYFINGKKASKTDFAKLFPNKVKELIILKRGSAAAIQKSPEGKTNDIYLIETK